MAKQKKMPTDLNQRAKSIVDFATSDEPSDEKDEARAAGGRKGGRARADKLTPEQRSQVAKKASQSRWARDAEEIPRTSGSLPFLRARITTYGRIIGLTTR
jgi:hypothetical protein